MADRTDEIESRDPAGGERSAAIEAAEQAGGVVADVRAGTPDSRREAGKDAGGATRGETVTSGDVTLIEGDGLPAATATTIQVTRGGIGRAEGEDVSVSMGGIGLARADRVSVELGGIGAAFAGEVEVRQGAANLVLAREVELEQAFVQSVVAARAEIEEGTNVLFLIAARVEGSVRPVLDWRGAVAFGAAFGIAAGLLRLRR